ncbi:UNVERIFIED_CONTAM: hypothetical protein Cloal_0838 [Acetivibrio alkalicellulosi]
MVNVLGVYFMKNNYVNKMVFKNNTAFLIIMLIITLIVINFLKPVYINSYNYFCGPFDIKLENLFSTSELEYNTRFISSSLPANHYANGNKFFYIIHDNRPIRTRVEDTVYKLDENNIKTRGVVYEYLLIKVNEMFLVVRVPLNSSATKFSGIILPLTPNLQHRIKVKAEDSSIDEKLLPFMFDATGNFAKDFYYQLAIAITLFAILILCFYKIIVRFINPRKHPLYKKIATYGSEVGIAESITREIMDTKYTRVHGKYIVTYNWTIKNSLFLPNITRNSRII